MKPEDLVERMKAVIPSGLKCVILYGSAAAGDHAGKRSDYNILVVMEDLGLAELQALSKPSRAWTRAGNPAPLLFTLDRLKKSADVFPIEMLDIKQSRKVLYGEDVMDGIEVSRENLRLELEHELKGKLIQLRERYLLTGGKPRIVWELLIRSLSTFLVLFRASLRLYRDDIPARKLDVLRALAEHVDFDMEVFTTIEAVKKGAKKTRDVPPNEIFDRYLRTIEKLTDAVDSYMRKS